MCESCYGQIYNLLELFKDPGTDNVQRLVWYINVLCMEVNKDKFIIYRNYSKTQVLDLITKIRSDLINPARNLIFEPLIYKK